MNLFFILQLVTQNFGQISIEIDQKWW